MIVSSTSFKNNGMIPQKHTGFGEDISPEFIITDAPEDTMSFAIILDDLDIPFCKSFCHWIVWNIPKTDIIPEGLQNISSCSGIAWGKHRYRGPKQPFFIRKVHRYAFTVYALDCQLDISEKSCKKNLLDAMHGHILAEASLIGRYQRK